MSQSDKQQNFMSSVVILAEDWLKVYEKARAIRDEWTKLGLSAEQMDAALIEEPQSANSHLTGAKILAVVVTIDNLQAFMDAGNGTNIFAVKP